MAMSTTAMPTKRRTRRLFYVGMAIAIAITAFVGFSPTYFLKAHYATPELSTLLHLHGAVLTLWVLWFLMQTTLVAAGKTHIHRRMGVAGAVLAALVVVLSTATAILRIKGGSVPIPGVPPLAFLAIPLFDMIVFASLIGSALYYRGQLEVHKRLMTLAMIELTSAPIARLDLPWLPPGPVTFFGLTDLFILVMVIHDLVTRRRIHPATIWGGLFIVVSQPLRLIVSETPAWLKFAGWITG